jgi:GT2 family glycosyltransferase
MELDDAGLPRVAVLILNWNGWADLVECLESVLRLDYPRFQVVICDNGSTDGSVDRVLDWAAGRLDILPQRDDMAHHIRPPVAKPLSIGTLTRTEAERGGDEAIASRPVLLISNGANLGFAAGNNVGLRYAMARDFGFVWLLNADTVVPPGALRPIVARMSSDTSIGMCGSLLCYYDAPETIEEAGGCAYYPLLGIARRLEKDRPVSRAGDWRETERRLGYVSGASCLVRGALLRDIGLMTEDLFLYGEEIDWAIRAAGRYSLAFALQSVVYHKKGRSTGSKSLGTSRSATSAYYLWRSRRRVTKRYHPIGLPALFSLGLLAAARDYLRGQTRSARAIMHGLLDRDFN